ncbi:hypothetical protein AC138_19395 [Pseudomonas putida]|nr:hypothetical protein AC138_19395 [Pseudomonas putida]KMY34153.1 hypothetical protein AA993_16425 [Pseudomonas putida]PXZ50014.1 hypothetical protein DM483_13140 [Pseudomonas sp. SMT-1]
MVALENTGHKTDLCRVGIKAWLRAARLGHYCVSSIPGPPEASAAWGDLALAWLRQLLVEQAKALAQG